MITVDNKYNIGDVVYLKTDDECKQRIVDAIIVTPKDILYELTCGVNTSKHYDFEMCEEKPVMI